MSNVANQLKVRDRIEILPVEGLADAGEYEVLEVSHHTDALVCEVREMSGGRATWIDVTAIERRGQEVRIVSEPRP